MQFQLSRKVILASAIALASQVSFVQAAGYGINEQSASYLGTGFAGRASNAIDASISASNPAAISLVEGRQVSVGADVILEGGKFENGKHSFRPNAPSSTEDFQRTSFVPFGYFVMPIDEKWSVGLGGYVPYGIELDYEDNWAGSWFGDETSVQVMALQGTVSYKIHDDLSVGFGLTGAHVKGKLTSRPMGAEGTIEGDDNTLAWNIGTLWNVNEQTTLGIAYHSTYDFHLKGDFTVVGSPGGVLDGTKDATLDIVMPEKLMFSVTYRLDEQWSIMADATWTRWTRFEEFDVKDPAGRTLNYVPMNWNNTWALSFGTSYQLNDQWLLRGGYMFDHSPVTNETRTVRSPDANRNWFTFGANWELAENINVDLAFAYVKLQDGTINKQKYDGPNLPAQPGYGVISGDYSSSSHILGAQLNYKF
ncbi:OmpP1/FadL family transporter [Endozoicomonas sp. YOMI1]|uniref:OmpP1/FadL family transporter n=1 Tax=Endozoicomonas sp. YOMI1 TaxID=2828739 RepID=UPI002148AD95|nr:OmpP1/FadL family transporter [Endozoicomonas sp. YOMI1]